ncbi:MAG TPA: hypothetical protein VF680_07325 [Allosphingosinicella sp.]
MSADAILVLGLVMCQPGERLPGFVGERLQEPAAPGAGALFLRPAADIVDQQVLGFDGASRSTSSLPKPAPKARAARRQVSNWRVAARPSGTAPSIFPVRRVTKY